MSSGSESLLADRSLGELLAAAEVRVEQMMAEELERVGGDVAASQAWFELRSLASKLRVEQTHVVLIERLLSRA